VPESGSLRSTTAAGWHAELDLCFAAVHGRTSLMQSRHCGPLRVQRPFYPENGVCHLYLVHPPGGLVSGDRLDIRVKAERDSQVLLTTPAAGKFYRSGDGRVAAQEVTIALDGAQVEYLPQETIFYPQARARAVTRVHLGEESRFIAWDVACYGLPARDERFSAGRVVQGFEVYRGGRPLLHERLHVDGATPMLTARWGFAGHAALGTMLAYPADGKLIDALRGLPELNAEADGLGLSCVDGLLVCRLLEQHADRAMQRLIAIWRALRPRLMGRAAVLPRIWAT
jgi:urease accessory protein